MSIQRSDDAINAGERADRRDPTSEAREDSAAQRDRAATLRDLAALARDQAADARDRLMAQGDISLQSEIEAQMSGTESVVRDAGRRKRAAQHYAMAADHRALAADDRRAAAQDRERAAHDRVLAATDPLTGARTRAAGMIELEHELDRCRRMGGLLVVAFVDVVGLKALNDSAGHRAGDQLLRRVVAIIGEHLRSYDLIIRLGGDEFLCVIAGMPLGDARERFDRVAAALADPSDAAAITTGFAALESGETTAQLIARADGELVASRNGHRDSRA